MISRRGLFGWLGGAVAFLSAAPAVAKRALFKSTGRRSFSLGSSEAPFIEAPEPSEFLSKLIGNPKYPRAPYQGARDGWSCRCCRCNTSFDDNTDEETYWHYEAHALEHYLEISQSQIIWVTTTENENFPDGSNGEFITVHHPHLKDEANRISTSMKQRWGREVTVKEFTVAEFKGAG